MEWSQEYKALVADTNRVLHRWNDDKQRLEVENQDLQDGLTFWATIAGILGVYIIVEWALLWL